MNRLLPYGKQWIDSQDIRAVEEVLQSGWLTCGSAVAAFETALSEYTGAKHVIAVSNGTAALHLAMLAARIGPGDRVVTSPNTFLASANCAEYTGATADFADIDSQTLNLSPDALRAAWRDDVKAVVAVDFAGRPCDMPAIAEIARSRGAVVVEDAAHSLGSRFVHSGKTYAVGGHPWADMTTFSFHPVKTLTTGEGGAIATDNDELAARCRLLRSHGMERSRAAEPWFYEMHQLGYNYRITDIQCALGCSQMIRLEQFISRRQAIVDAYNDAFGSLRDVQTPYPDIGGRSAWHLYAVCIDFQRIGKCRAQVMEELKLRGVGTQVHYIPVHLQPYYREKYGYGSGKCPFAESYYQKCLSLPLYPAMTDGDVALVIDAVCKVVS